MKKTLHHFLKALVLALFFISNSFSQQASWVEMMQDPNANFYEVQNAFYSYWEGRTITKGKGYKVFKRWEEFMKPRVYPTGEMTQASQAYSNFLQWERNNPIPTNKSIAGDWQMLGPVGAPTNGGAGRLNFIRFDPTTTNTIYVGAPDGGLWKSTNGGTSWTTNTDQLAVIGCTDIAIDPTNTQIMYLATGDGDAADSYSVGVLKSTNGGTTWNTSGLDWTVNQGRTISKLLMHPTNSSILLAATSNGVYRTTNAGTSWTQVRTGSFKDMEFKPGDPNTVYVAGTTFQKSTDNGATWTTITSGLPSSNIQRIAIAVSEANSDYVYLLYGRSDDQGLLGVYRSTNSGTSFTQRHGGSPNLLGWESNGSDEGGQAFYDLTIAASPLNAEVVIVGGVNLWRSTNGGSSFSINGHWWGDVAPYVHADHHDIVFIPGSSTYYSANDGGINRTTNNGSTWTDLSSNLAIAQQYRIGLSASNASLLVAGHQDNGTNKLNGTTWSEIYGGDGMDCFIDRTNNNIIIASYVYGEHKRSTNGGGSFSNITSGLPTGNNAEWLSTIRQDPNTASTYLAGGRTALYRSTNSGSSWASIGTPSGTGKIIEFSIAPSNSAVIYTVKDNAVSKTINTGSNWSNVSTGLPTSTVSPTYVAISNTNPDVAFVTFSGYSSTNKVFKTTNGGTSWTNISSGLPNVPCNTIVYQNNSAVDAVYVGTDIGVYYRDNTMTDWIYFSNGLPRVAVRDLEIYYPTSRLRAATYGRGTWDSDLYSGEVAPIADFSASQTNLITGQSTTFTDLSSGNPTSYSWTFSGGTPNTSTSANPTITYNTVGTFNVSLTVTNGTGSDSETKDGYIIVSSPPAPTADFFATPTTGNVGQTIAFTNTSTGSPTSYSWTFTGGTPSTSTQTNPAVVYNTAGVYTVSLTATNANGSDIETKTNYITINSVTPPVADFTASSTLICPNQTITFNSTSSGNPTSYSWSFPGGTPSTSTLASPTVTYATNGTFNVSLTVTNAGGSDTETKNNFINVNQGSGIDIPYFEGFTTNAFLSAPYSYVNAGGSDNWEHSISIGTTPTAGNSMYFNNYSNDNRTFNDEVHFPSLNLTSLSAPYLTFDVAYAGYDADFFDGLEVLVSNDCGTSFNSVYLKSGTTLATAPNTTAPFTPLSNQWRTETVDLSAYSSSTGLIISFKNISGYGNFLYIDNVNINGTVLNPPFADFSSNESVICQGSTVSFNNLSTGNPTSYSWSFPGGTPSTSTEINPTVTYNSAGTFDVTLSVSNSNGSDSYTSVNHVQVLASTTQNLPFNEGFVESTFPPNGWASQNVGDVNFWQRSDVVGINPTAGNSMFYNNLDFDETGNNDEIWMPKLNLSGVTNPTLTFDVAYAPYSATYSDGLEVLISTDCGVTFSSVYAKSGLVLATAPETTTTFVPLSNQWRNETIDLSSFASENNVLIAFRNVAGYGNHLYIDNINVNGTILDLPTASFFANETTVCSGSSVNFTNTSTGNPTTYSWTFSGGTPLTSTQQNPIVTYNTAGVYNVSLTVSNSNGSDSETLNGYITVNATPSTPTITNSGTNSFCQGESTTLTSSSSIGNTWSTGETTNSIIVNSTGSYSVTVTQNNCSATSSSLGINVIPSAVISLGTLTNPTSCGTATGSIVVTSSATGTGTISWTGSSSGSQANVSLPFTITNLVAGNYEITFTNTCISNTLTASLSDPGAPSTPVITTIGSTTICQGGSVILTSSATSNNVWSTGETSNSITVTNAGTYFVSVVENDCQASSQPIEIIVNNNPAIFLGTITEPASCGTSTGSIVVNGIATGTISWAGANSGSENNVTLPYTISNLSAGSYSISFNNGCNSNVLSANINDPGAPTTPTITVNGTTEFCDGESVTLISSATSGNLWSNGETTNTITVNSSGIYSVSVTQNNCTASSIPIQIIVNSIPVITLGTLINPSSCEGSNGSITINGSGNGQITWAGTASGTQTGITLPYTIGNLTAGSYAISFNNGCSSNLVSTNLSDPGAPAVPTITVSGSTTICVGESVTLTSSASSGNTWSNGSTSASITVSTPGTYSVTVTQNNCSASSNPVNIFVINPPTISAGNISHPSSCGGIDGFVTIEGNGTGTLTWSGSQSGIQTNIGLPFTVSNLNAGNYSFNFSNGCSSNTLDIVLNEPIGPNVPTISLSGSNSICEGESVTLTSSATSGNTWSNNATTNSILVSTSGTFTVTVVENNCSATSIPMTIVVNSLPTVSISTIPQMCISDNTFILSQGSPSGGIYSGNGVTNNEFNPQNVTVGLQTITYTFTDNNGCSNSANTTFMVDDCGSISNKINDEISIYPNPTKDFIYIKGKNLVEIRLIDQTGKMLQKQMVNSELSQINVSSFSNGIYHLEIIGKDFTITNKIEVIK
jgi:PKD repeat protein